MQQGIAQGPHDVLVAERCGPHVLIRRGDEAAADHGFLGGAPSGPRQLFVLATAGSQGDPAFVTTVGGLLRSLPGVLSGVKSVWLGATGVASNAAVLMGFARELNVDVCVPDGQFAAAPGAAMYAGHGMGGNGWLRFRADGPAVPAGNRFPVPPWESAMPTVPMAMAGVAVTPIPAGVLVRASPVGVDDVVFGVTADQRFPKIVIGGGDGPTPSPATVAGVLDRLLLESFLLVPAVPEAASHLWQVELALRLSREVVFSTSILEGGGGSPDSTGAALFRPFPTVLRQGAGGGDQEVLDIAPAPPGWVRNGPHGYRFSEGGVEVLADVVPSGLVLRSPASAQPVEPASFDPSGWTLTLGVRDETVGLPVLVAAERLLDALGPRQRAAVRVRVSGLLDEQARTALSLGKASKPVVLPARTAPPVAVREGAVPESYEPKLADLPVFTPPETVSPPLAMVSPPTIVTMSNAPVSTVSSSPTRPDARQGDRPVDFLSGGVEPVVSPAPAAQDSLAQNDADTSSMLEPVAVADPSPAADEQAPAVPELADHAPPPDLPSPPAGEPESTMDAAPLNPLVIPDRPSTPAEQSRFTAASGEAFGEAMATVNAALATWPSMRQENTPGVKADYVAVCLYLGRTDGNTTSLSAAVRAGESGPIDGQLPCLVSGIRRLPIHRRAVLRQGKLGESLEHRTAVGTLLTEPGFLTASMDLDVTLPGADLDVLIWPSSARRTSELLMGHPMDEAVFLAGSRFKALAVRTVEDDGEDPEDDGVEGVAAPKVAVLYRELSPGESPTTAELDARDLAVLVRLDRVLATRQKGGLRLVEDPDTVNRLTTSMVEWSDQSSVSGQGFRSTLAAS